jgi:hypothetical protein
MEDGYGLETEEVDAGMEPGIMVMTLWEPPEDIFEVQGVGTLGIMEIVEAVKVVGGVEIV